jgi:hypothetical protein
MNNARDYRDRKWERNSKGVVSKMRKRFEMGV